MLAQQLYRGLIQQDVLFTVKIHESVNIDPENYQIFSVLDRNRLNKQQTKTKQRECKSHREV